MSLLQNAVKASRLIRTVAPNQALLRPILSAPTRHFSADAQQPSTQPTASYADPFLQTPVSGLFYGRLHALAKQAISIHTLKSDILRMLDECNLGPEDLKISYDVRFEPAGVMIQFPSSNAYEAALRTINRKGRLYRLEKVGRSHWDNTRFYDGKFLLLQGLPRNATPEDIDRLLSNSEHDSSSIQMFMRPDTFNPLRMAVVRFRNASLAMNAFITKNRSFCLNNQILMQVLH